MFDGVTAVLSALAAARDFAVLRPVFCRVVLRLRDFSVCSSSWPWSPASGDAVSCRSLRERAELECVAEAAAVRGADSAALAVSLSVVGRSARVIMLPGVVQMEFVV